jgi:hypothetical protein
MLLCVYVVDKLGGNASIWAYFVSVLVIIAVNSVLYPIICYNIRK